MSPINDPKDRQNITEQTDGLTDKERLQAGCAAYTSQSSPLPCKPSTKIPDDPCDAEQASDACVTFDPGDDAKAEPPPPPEGQQKSDPMQRGDTGLSQVSLYRAVKGLCRVL